MDIQIASFVKEISILIIAKISIFYQSTRIQDSVKMLWEFFGMRKETLV